jgi:hypothetical protein
VQHLRTFGCVVHVKDTTLHLKKLDDRSRHMIFIDYEPGSKAYRVYDPVARKVHVSIDIVFDEQAEWDWNIGGEYGDQAGDDDTFITEMEYSMVTQGTAVANDRVGSPATAKPIGLPNHLHQSPTPA